MKIYWNTQHLPERTSDLAASGFLTGQDDDLGGWHIRVVASKRQALEAFADVEIRPEAEPFVRSQIEGCGLPSESEIAVRTLSGAAAMSLCKVLYDFGPHPEEVLQALVRSAPPLASFIAASSADVEDAIAYGGGSGAPPSVAVCYSRQQMREHLRPPKLKFGLPPDDHAKLLKGIRRCPLPERSDREPFIFEGYPGLLLFTAIVNGVLARQKS